MPLHASARRLGGSLRHEVVIDGHHRIVTDEPVRLGGIDAGPTPHELERLRHVAASCPVHRALEAGFSFEQRLVRTPRLLHADAA